MVLGRWLAPVIDWAMLILRPLTFLSLFLILLGGTLIPSPTAAKAVDKLPHFASLRSDKVNVRVGPGVRYPVAWVYVRKNLPIEVLAEFELWRKIRDREGIEGWVHNSLLSGIRSVIIKGGIQTLFRRAGGTVPVLRAQSGVQGRLLTCAKSHCRVRISGTEGWISRKALWGIYPGETFN